MVKMASKSPEMPYFQGFQGFYVILKNGKEMVKSGKFYHFSNNSLETTPAFDTTFPNFFDQKWYFLMEKW